MSGGINKNVKVLIIGFGSIGQRHYGNLQKLGMKNVYVYDTDTKKLAGWKLKTVKKINTAALKEFGVVFICTPTSMHAKTAILAAQAGCHLFIEKPLSNTPTGIKKLVDISKRKKLVTFVACNLRFLPAIRKVKKLLENRFLGKVHAIYLEYGKYLPYQRPGVDYSKIYAAKKSLGGGTILDDVHDFDLLFWLVDFRKICKSDFIFAKVSNLKIDTEDICSAHFLFAGNIMGGVRCDYLQQYKHKDLKIIGERGNLLWNFRENALFFEYVKNNKELRKELFSGSKIDDDSAYLEELKYFLSCVQNKRPTFNDVETALLTLQGMKI